NEFAHLPREPLCRLQTCRRIGRGKDAHRGDRGQCLSGMCLCGTVAGQDGHDVVGKTVNAVLRIRVVDSVPHRSPPAPLLLVWQPWRRARVGTPWFILRAPASFCACRVDFVAAGVRSTLARRGGCRNEPEDPEARLPYF